MEKNQRRALLSWLFVGALFVLCGVLGFLQYRWIGEVSVAEQERLRGSLQASLFRLSQEFNSEISTARRAILPFSPRAAGGSGLEAEIAARYEHWKSAGRHARMFDRIALAVPGERSLPLLMLDPASGTFRKSKWPAEWSGLRERVTFSAARARRQDGGAPPPGPDIDRPDDGVLFVVPLFTPPSAASGAPGLFIRIPVAVAILELNLQYVREEMLPELVQRYLEAGGTLDYQVEVVTRTNPPTVIFQSDPGEAGRIAGTADASVGLCELEPEQIFRRGGPMMGGRGFRSEAERGAIVIREAGPGPGPGGGPGPDFGRWEMYVRHRAGSLEAAVDRVRRRNLAVTAGVLLLMVGALAALIRSMRRAQKLAEMQMEFVAGVSHELRTPLTVIHTAGYNLQGKMAQNPGQVERYGALIQKESGRLRDLVEQVLEFARVKTGRVIQDREPLSIEAVIEEAMESSRSAIEAAHCEVEMKIAPGLPCVMGDAGALRRALENLIGNAAKYGSKPNHWIGISASRAGDVGAAAVEIRVADRGPGIPPEEQKHIFDAFFRGRRAIEGQIHGTGLGLNLAKKIVEAHGGSVRVRSQEAAGTEFIVRIPAAADDAST